MTCSPACRRQQLWVHLTDQQVCGHKRPYSPSNTRGQKISPRPKFRPQFLWKSPDFPQRLFLAKVCVGKVATATGSFPASETDRLN